MRFLSSVSSKNTHFLSTSQSLVQMFASLNVPSHRSAGVPKRELHFSLVKKVENSKFMHIMMAEFLAPETVFA